MRGGLSACVPVPGRIVMPRQLPMTLGNMRQRGIHSLSVYCGALWCHHEAVLDVSSFADDMTVPSFCPRMVCTVCGAIGADARPNWNERAPASLYGPRLSN